MDTAADAFACRLEGSELLDRLHAWEQVVSRATNRRIEGNRLIATYPNDAALLRQVRELVDAEATCCPFLECVVEERSDRIVTELRLPNEMPAPMRSMILAFMGEAAATT